MAQLSSSPLVQQEQSMKMAIQSPLPTTPLFPFLLNQTSSLPFPVAASAQPKLRMENAQNYSLLLHLAYASSQSNQTIPCSFNSFSLLCLHSYFHSFFLFLPCDREHREHSHILVSVREPVERESLHSLTSSFIFNLHFSSFSFLQASLPRAPLLHLLPFPVSCRRERERERDPSSEKINAEEEEERIRAKLRPFVSLVVSLFI